MVGRRSFIAKGKVAALCAMLFATSAVLGLALAAPPTVFAALPGAAGLIAYQVDAGSGFQVWVMHPDGTGKTQITSSGKNSNPAWSPDGTRIAFSSDRDGNAEIYVMNADGSDETRLTNDAGTDVQPTWSSDGSQIAWARYGNTSLNYDVWVMNADGSNAVDITNDPAADLEPSWRPGTSTIAFESNRAGGNHIFLVRSDGSGLVDITSPAAADQSDPDWSPDGSMLALTQNGAIATMSASGSGLKTLSAHSDLMPAWSPDGKRISFVSFRDLNAEVYVMNADGAAQTRLTNNGGPGNTLPEDFFPDWQPAPAAFTPAEVSFGTIALGSASAGRAIIVTNGLTSLSIASVTITGSNAADFELVSETCTHSDLQPLATCAAIVRAHPQSTGTKSASVTFAVTGHGNSSVAISATVRPFLWAAIRSAGPAYTWSDEGGLARTSSGSTAYLHVIYDTDRVGGGWANDTTRKVGAYYIRSSNGGATWTTPKRLNPTTQQGDRAAIAAYGSNVYAVWVSQTKWIHYSGTAPRILYFRRNSNNGASTAWGATIRLTSSSGRVDYPKIAVSGTYVFVTYTDSSTGSVKIAISANRGATWKTVTVGSTSRTTKSGRGGFPIVTAAGRNVGVAWVSSGTGALQARISTTLGSTWSSTVTLGTTSSTPAAAAVGSRVAIAWTEGSTRFAVWSAGTWSSPIVLPPTDGYSSEVQQDPAIALLGAGGVAIAYTACTADCTFSDAGVSATGDEVLRTTPDSGASWSASDLVAAHVTTRRMNDGPTLLWPAATKPFVLWNGWNEESLLYRLYLRIGG